jgi:type III pantothenate kinase
LHFTHHTSHISLVLHSLNQTTELNLAVDIGNSRIKVAYFNGSELVTRGTYLNAPELQRSFGSQRFENCIVSSVKTEPTDILSLLPVEGKRLQLTSMISLPITIAYDTPETLGVDRIAAACGASQIFPGQDCLVIDMGTCITYDFLSEKGTFEGGSISPGVRMRFAAMNQLTARLPKVEPIANAPLTGKSTVTSMQSGVINGVLEEIKGFIARYKSQHSQLKTVACGGDLTFFENSIKPSIFVAPDLVLIGLNRILLHHVNV